MEHHGKHPFQCDVCGHKATDECRLKKHLLCHEPDRPREYCNICFKEFRNKVSLRTHRNMVHKVRIIPTIILVKIGQKIAACCISSILQQNYCELIAARSTLSLEREAGRSKRKMF